ncbi:MAG: DUF362 domain-containing protein [Armatimonadota bacterium]
MSKPRVALLRCGAEATEAEIAARTREAVTMVGGLRERLAGKRKIVVKPNIGIDRVRLTGGRQTELTEPAVVEGVLQALREVTDAEILIGDAPTDDSAAALYEKLGYDRLVSRFQNVRMVDFGAGPFVEVEVPGEPLQFSRYWLHHELAEADACVSVAKMKAHRSLGCTLCIKNLFGLTPWRIYGQPRVYLHDRLVRLPRVQVDLAAYFKPALCVVDGIMTANHGEWHGTPIETGVLLAGESCVATDSVGMQVMGFNPLGDYPDHPHWYRRNSIRLAHEAGLGTADPDEIEVLGEEPAAVRQRFEVQPYGEGASAREAELAAGVRCVERYQEQRDRYLRDYEGRYLTFRDGELLWDAPDMAAVQALEKERCAGWRDAPHFTIRAVPAAREIERLETYAAGG